MVNTDFNIKSSWNSKHYYGVQKPQVSQFKAILVNTFYLNNFQ